MWVNPSCSYWMGDPCPCVNAQGHTFHGNNRKFQGADGAQRVRAPPLRQRAAKQSACVEACVQCETAGCLSGVSVGAGVAVRARATRHACVEACVPCEMAGCLSGVGVGVGVAVRGRATRHACVEACVPCEMAGCLSGVGVGVCGVSRVHTKKSARACIRPGKSSRCLLNARLCAKIGWHVGLVAWCAVLQYRTNVRDILLGL
jgi:hypothetical protein